MPGAGCLVPGAGSWEPVSGSRYSGSRTLESELKVVNNLKTPRDNEILARIGNCKMSVHVGGFF